MARETTAQLRARLEALEAENARLRDEAAAAAVEPDAGPRPRPRRPWPWTLLAVTLIVLGAVLAPVAVVASWAGVTLTDTDRFVATYAPLADDPEVQAFVAAQVVAAIEEQVDIPAITSGVIDGIIELGTGPVATLALESLKGPAAAGIHGLLESQVQQFTASEAFSSVWAQALRLSHAQLVGAMLGDGTGAVVISDAGEVGIQLAPIIEEVKAVLVAQGLTFAEQIPAIDRTIVVAQSDVLPTVRLAYGLTVDAATWLPILALALLAVGVLVARRRPVALIGAAVGLAVAMGAVLAGVGVGRIAFLAATGTTVPNGVGDVLFGSVTDGMRETATSVLVLAVAVAVVGWLAGPFRTPRLLRGFAVAGADAIRDAAAARGITTGRVGAWIGRRIGLLRGLVAVVAGAVVLLARPLSPSLVLWTLVLGAIALAVLELLRRPAAVEAAADDPVAEAAV